MNVQTECGSCFVDVEVDVEAATATATVPSNGKRGRAYVAPHVVTVEGFTDGHLAYWECPVCGYPDSTYVDAAVRADLAG